MDKDPSLTFFSYSRDDSEFAHRLANDLRASGAAVWVDQLDISPGQRWDQAVEDALANCPRMLIILSPSSVNSDNVMDEVSFALEEQKTVIPVLYRDCKMPFRLRRVQFADFRTDYPGGLNELVKTLGVASPYQPPETAQTHGATQPAKAVAAGIEMPVPGLSAPAAASIAHQQPTPVLSPPPVITSPVESPVAEKPARSAIEEPVRHAAVEVGPAGTTRHDRRDSMGLKTNEPGGGLTRRPWFWFGALVLGIAILAVGYLSPLKDKDSVNHPPENQKAPAEESSKGPSNVTEVPETLQPVPPQNQKAPAAESSKATSNVTEVPETLQPVVLPNPPFQYTSLVDKPALPSRIRLQKISQKLQYDLEKWFVENQLSLPSIQIPPPVFGTIRGVLRPNFMMSEGNVPSAVPKRYGQGDVLINFIQGGDHWLAGYGRNFSGSRYLIGYDRPSGKPIFAYDFERYLTPPEYVRKKNDAISELVIWACIQGNILYVSNFYSGYAEDARGLNGYLNAINIRSNQLVWRSRPLISNSQEFAIYKDAIITGYGQTEERDYLYVLDNRDGSIVQTIPVVKRPDHILIKGDLVYVRAYDTGYVFRIIEQ